MRRITETLRTYLPIRFEEPLDVLFGNDETYMGFPYLFFLDFVAAYGQEEEGYHTKNCQMKLFFEEECQND